MIDRFGEDGNWLSSSIGIQARLGFCLHKA
jgi:hypothetical protein